MLTAAAAFADESETPNLEVTAVSAADGRLIIGVTDALTGSVSQAEVSLPESGPEFITVQVVDESGNRSGEVVIRNPNYIAPEAQTDGGTVKIEAVPDEPVPTAEPVPFTPEGTGEVRDNASGEDGKEFFTIAAKDNKVFYLIIDRQRGGENVYFLDAVTTEDLQSLAEGESPSPKPAIFATPAPEQTAAPAQTTPKSGVPGGSVVFIALAAAVVGAAGWYFKIYKPKQQYSGYDYDDDDINDGEDNDEL
jgi:hypothetical protein